MARFEKNPMRGIFFLLHLYTQITNVNSCFIKKSHIMKKHLSLLFVCAALLTMPALTQAQGLSLTNSDLPYTFTFESGMGDEDFLNFANGADGWYIGTAAHSVGSYGLYVSDDNGVGNNYSTANVYSYVWVDLDITESGVYEFSFDWKCTGENNYDYMYVYWAPQTVTPTANNEIGGGATQIGGQFGQQSSWQQYYNTVTITPSELGQYRLIFMWKSDVSVSNPPAAAIDNLYIGKLTCPSPVSLSFSSYTNNGATASWTPVGDESSWIVYLDGVPVADNPVNATTYDFYGLDPNTEYSVSVRAFCGNNDTSMMLNGHFRTLCQNGNCQVQVNNTSQYYGGVDVWQNGSLVVTLQSSYMYGEENNTIDICNGDSLIITYHAGNSSYGSNIIVIDVAGTELANVSKASLNNGDTILAVANACPTCMPIQALYRATIDAFTTNLHWTDNNVSGLGDYVIYANGDVAGFVSGDSTFVLNTNAVTEYTVSVVRVCDVEDTSAARSVSFFTPCDESEYAPLPFSTSFEELNTNQSPDCWVQVQTGGNGNLGAVFPSAYRWQPNAHTGSVYFEFESQNGSETEILALPRMENVADLQLSFYAATTVTRNHFILDAGVIEVDDEGGYVFVPVDTVELYAGPNEAWGSSYRVYNVLFDSYEGNGERLAIRTSPTDNQMYTLMIDDFTVIYAGSPVLGPFDPATHTVNVDTNLVLTANLMTGDGVTYTWTSTMVESGLAEIVSQDSNTITIHYSNGGLDSVAVIASTGFGEDDTAVVMITVVDESPISQFPYSNGFEDGEDFSWRASNSSNGWYIGSAAAYEGSHSLYISDMNGSTNTYGQVTGSSSAYRTIVFDQAGEYQFNFMWRNNGNSSSYMHAYIVQGDVVPVGSSTYSWTSVSDNLYGQSSWEQFEGVIDVDTGIYTLIFYWYNNTTINNPPAAVDNIYIERLNCSRVSDLAVSSVYAHGATVSWSPRNDESEWWIVVDTTDGYSVNESSVQLTGFDGLTQHTVKVSAICGDGDTSAARTITFTTTIACPAVTEIHATEVAGNTATIEWMAGGVETEWKVVVLQDSVVVGDTIEVSDEPIAYLTDLDILTQYTVVVIADCGDEDGLSVSSTGTFVTLCNDAICDLTLELSDSYGDGWNNGSLNVVQNGTIVGSGTIPAGNNSALLTVPVCSTMPVSVVFNAGNYPSEMGATIYSGSGAELYSFTAGDMTAANNGETLLTASTPCAGCARPTNMVASSIEENSITIIWAANDSAEGFIVSVDGGAWEAASGNTYTATGLNAATDYTFAVRTICSDEDSSTSRTLTVRTACGPVNIPWNEGFEQFSTTDNCWNTIIPSGSGIATANNVHSGSSSLRFNGYASNPLVVCLPEFAQEISGLELSMWVRAEDILSGVMRIGYITDITDSSTFVSVTDFDYAPYEDVYGQVLVSFEGAPAGARIAIEQVNNGDNYWWWIDDLEVDVIGTHPQPGIECDAPAIDSLVATENSATVTFNGAAASYEVAIVAGSWVAPANPVSITTTVYTFTNLQAGTLYNVGVRAVCDDITTSAWIYQSVTTTGTALPCTCEVPTDLHMVSIDNTSAVVDWTPGENNVSWDIEVDGQVTNTTSHPYTISGLEADHAYTVRVRAHCCDIDEISAWTSAITLATTGIDDVSTLTIALTPNPATDVVELSGVCEGALVHVLDINGRIVRNITASGERMIIDLDGLAAGAYIVRVSDGNGLAMRKLIVK